MRRTKVPLQANCDAWGRAFGALELIGASSNWDCSDSGRDSYQRAAIGGQSSSAEGISGVARCVEFVGCRWQGAAIFRLGARM